MNSAYKTFIEGVLDNGYGIFDNFLTARQVGLLNKTMEGRIARGEFRYAGIGRGAEAHVESAVRGDRICWLDEETAKAVEKIYFNKINLLLNTANRIGYLGLLDCEMHYAEYPVGAFYKRHLDRFRSDSRRRLSVVCYLNSDWVPGNGGELRLFLPEGEKTIAPLGGRLVCFESDKLEHEVLPAAVVRRSLTGWLRTR